MAFRLEVLSLLVLAVLGIYDGIRMTKVRLAESGSRGAGMVSADRLGDAISLCRPIFLPRTFPSETACQAEKKPRAFSLSIDTLGWMLIVLVGYTLATPASDTPRQRPSSSSSPCTSWGCARGPRASYGVWSLQLFSSYFFPILPE